VGVDAEEAAEEIPAEGEGMGTAPGPELEEIIAEEPAADLGEGKGALAEGESSDTEAETAPGEDQSIESIVQDLKRERGQS
jgi:hypothetical protein